MDIERTADRARGRWRELLPALGIPNQFLSGKHGPCPLCGGKDRYRFTDRLREGDYFCGQCGAGQGIKLVMKFNGWEFKEVAQKIDALVGRTTLFPRGVTELNPLPDNRALRKLWLASQRATCDDLVGRYLASRSIVDAIPSSLRFVPQMRHAQSNKDYPGMLALFSGPDGKPSTLHRTYLTESGAKANIEPSRTFMPGKIAKGGAVRLYPCSERMGIAEGIETAMSASLIHNMPCWAALNEALLRAWEPPLETTSIIIFGDNDETFVGQCAAFDLAKRLMRDRRIAVEVKIPKRAGWDWNTALHGAMQ